MQDTTQPQSQPNEKSCNIKEKQSKSTFTNNNIFQTINSFLMNKKEVEMKFTGNWGFEQRAIVWSKPILQKPQANL